MEIVKVGLVMMAGLGSTWVARTTTDALLGPATAGALVQATQPAPQAAPSAGSPPAMPELSREEMQAELKRAQAEIAGRRLPAEMEEFRPTKPLAADLAISLPSDI